MYIYLHCCCCGFCCRRCCSFFNQNKYNYYFDAKVNTYCLAVIWDCTLLMERDSVWRFVFTLSKCSISLETFAKMQFSNFKSKLQEQQICGTINISNKNTKPYHSKPALKSHHLFLNLFVKQNCIVKVAHLHSGDDDELYKQSNVIFKHHTYGHVKGYR